jgi:4-hydroxyacetophenone monooxygenase
MQIVPAIADQVAELTVYQRTAQWARPIPRYHEPIPEGSQRLFEHLPFYASWFRFVMLWRYGDGLLPLLRKDPDWEHPHSINRANERHRQQMADHLLTELDGRADLVEKCMPSYPPYGKRILLDNGWFATIRKPNVELVVDSADHVDATGVVADGQHREHDIVVLANGFEVFQGASRLGLRGRNGVDLAELWANDDPKAYLGITVADFPNFFIMQGPTTGLGHGGSAIFQAECHARHISACVAAMSAADGRTIEVREQPMVNYTDAFDAEHEHLIWSTDGLRNWYRNDAGRVVVIMPWRLVDYWSMTHDPDLNHYSITS